MNTKRIVFNGPITFVNNNFEFFGSFLYFLLPNFFKRGSVVLKVSPTIPSYVGIIICYENNVFFELLKLYIKNWL